MQGRLTSSFWRRVDKHWSFCSVIVKTKIGTYSETAATCLCLSCPTSPRKLGEKMVGCNTVMCVHQWTEESNTWRKCVNNKTRLLQSLDQQGMPLLHVPVKPYTSWHCDRENRPTASSRLLLHIGIFESDHFFWPNITWHQNIVLPFCHSLNNNGLCQLHIFQTPKFNETEVVQYCHSLFLSRNSKGKGIK